MSGILQKVVGEIYDAFARGDIPAVLRHFAVDIAWDQQHPDHGIPWLKPRLGIKSVEEFFEILPKELQISRFQPLHTFVTRDGVIGVVDFEAVVTRSGKTLKDIEMHVFTFKDNRVIAFDHKVDTHEHWLKLH